jgi:MFS family permease
VLSSYSIVTVSQGRALFPERLAGRGVTTVNMAQVLGSAVLPALAGYIVGSFAGLGEAPGAPAPEEAYRCVFAMLGAGSCIGLAFYLRSKDSRPKIIGQKAFSKLK